MSETIKAWQRRSRWTQEINGDTWHLQQLSASELQEAYDLEKGDQRQASQWFIFCCCVTDADGARVVPRQSGESAAEYATRAMSGEFSECSIDVIRDVTDAVSNKLKPPTVDAVKKN